MKLIEIAIKEEPDLKREDILGGYCPSYFKFSKFIKCFPYIQKKYDSIYDSYEKTEVDCECRYKEHPKICNRCWNREFDISYLESLFK